MSVQLNTTPINSFEDYKKRNLSKIHTYTDENKQATYFYFYKGQRSNYFQLHTLNQLNKQFEQHETELIKEYRQLRQT